MNVFDIGLPLSSWSVTGRIKGGESRPEEQRLLQLQTTWTDRKGQSQRLDLNSLIAWDDPGAEYKLTKDTSGTLISPTGQAQRGTGSLSPDGLWTCSVVTSYDMKKNESSSQLWLLSTDGKTSAFLGPPYPSARLSSECQTPSR